MLTNVGPACKYTHLIDGALVVVTKKARWTLHSTRDRHFCLGLSSSLPEFAMVPEIHPPLGVEIKNPSQERCPTKGLVPKRASSVFVERSFHLSLNEEETVKGILIKMNRF